MLSFTGMGKLLTALFTCALLSSGVALAQGGQGGISSGSGAESGQAELSAEQDARARRLAGQLMSPFCPGRTLNECPSPSATEWREDIRTWVSEGVEGPEIRRRLEERAPEADLTGNPGGDSTISPLLWIALAALALPAAILLPMARRWRRRSEDPPEDAPAADATPEQDELDERLDDELERYDG